MKTIISLPKLGISALAFVMLFAVSAASAFAQGGKAPTPSAGQATTLSPEEVAAIAKVKAATDANGALLAATEYIKNFPNSAARGDVGDQVAAKISLMPDAAQRPAMCDRVIALFTGVGEVDGLFDMLNEKKLVDESFRLGAARLQKVPNEIKILTQLTFAGRELLKTKNNKYEAVTQEYALKAISIIKAGNKPPLMPDAAWKEYETKWLPELYKTAGMIAFTKKDDAGAQKLFQQAMAIDPSDAFTYEMLAEVSDNEYTDVATKYMSNRNDPGADLVLKKALNLMDQTIDLYVHAVALSEGKDQLKEIHARAATNLEKYYKFRHNNSTAGMQELIDKYKKPANP